MRSTLLLLFLALTGATAFAQNVNDAVEIEFKGVWYPGNILKAEGEKYFVSYDEWDAVWNEWVGQERLRNSTVAAPPPPPAPQLKYHVGDRVEIQFGFGTVNATVMGIGEGKYELKMDDMDTIWYTEDFIIRKL
jgi:hypothetical protein